MKTWTLIPLLGIMLWSCGKSNRGLSGLLCSLGHNQSALTVGLNLDLLRGLMLREDDSGISNEDLQTYLNDALSGLVSSNVLHVKTVSSINNNDRDEVRFLQLGGSFAPGFGVATNFFKDLAGQLGLQEGSLFRFIQESYNVTAAVPNLSKPLRWEPWLRGQDSAGLQTFMGSSLRQNGFEGHPKQWAYQQTQWQKALEYLEVLRSESQDASSADNPVIVAIMDTGVDGDHPDLKDIMWHQGFDALDTDTGTHDENGHGTHCAGIVASQLTNPGTSPLGVAVPGHVRIMPIKVLDKNGAGGFQAIEKGLQWAIHHANPRPDVLSLSLGAGLEYQDLDENTRTLTHALIQEAIDKNIIVVVAAGNEACPLGGSCRHRQGIFQKSFSEYTVLPCAYKGVICVGASDPSEDLAAYSNYSSKKADAAYRTKADVNAPGTNIYSTWPTALGSYRTISGTSMATPYVAGIAALMKSVKRDLNQEEFLKIIQDSQIYPEAMQEKSEAGRVDLYQALVKFGETDLSAPPPTDYKEPVPTPVEDPEPANSGNTVFDLWSAICG